VQLFIEFEVIETSIRAKRLLDLEVALFQNVLDDTPPTILLG
jgi:hypothetical protein